MAQKPMRVVIATLNSRYIHASLAPWCLAAGVARLCNPESIRCTVVEGTVNEPTESVLSRILAESPDLLGLSCYIWNIKQSLAIAEKCKTLLPDLRIVLGGPEVSYCPNALLEENSSVDFILSGEGEESFPALVNALLSGADPTPIPSLSLRLPDGTLKQGTSATLDGEPPNPYTDECLAHLKGRLAYLETSRGCPFHCTFCLSGQNGTVRYFDTERAKADMLRLAQNGAATVKLVDRTFNADRARACELWRFIADEYGKGIPTGTRFHFEIAGELLDEASFAILSAMPVGAVQLEVGLQSFHPETLRAIRRNPNTAHLERNVRRLTAMKNVHTHIDLIAGLPFEGYKTFVKGFDRAYALGADMLQLGFLKLLHGAPMTDPATVYDCVHSEEPPYEVVSTPYITKEELDRLRTVADALDRLGNSGRFRRTLAYLIGECGLSPFRLFLGFGEWAEREGIPKALDAYTNAFCRYAGTLSGVDGEHLCDCLVQDRLATNSSGVIPQAIRNFDKRIKRARVLLNRRPHLSERKGIRRTYAALRRRDCVIWADYGERHPVSGEYPLFEMTWNDLEALETEVTE